MNLLKQTFLKTADMLQQIERTKTIIIDSTPIVNLYDMEAAWGYNSGGKF